MLSLKRIISIWHKLAIIFTILSIFENIVKIRIDWFQCLFDENVCKKEENFIEMSDLKYIEIPVLIWIFYMIGIIKATTYFIIPYYTTNAIIFLVDEIITY